MKIDEQNNGNQMFNDGNSVASHLSQVGTIFDNAVASADVLELSINFITAEALRPSKPCNNNIGASQILLNSTEIPTIVQIERAANNLRNFAVAQCKFYFFIIT